MSAEESTSNNNNSYKKIKHGLEEKGYIKEQDFFLLPDSTDTNKIILFKGCIISIHLESDRVYLTGSEETKKLVRSLYRKKRAATPLIDSVNSKKLRFENESELNNSPRSLPRPTYNNNKNNNNNNNNINVKEEEEDITFVDSDNNLNEAENESNEERDRYMFIIIALQKQIFKLEEKNKNLQMDLNECKKQKNALIESVSNLTQYNNNVLNAINKPQNNLTVYGDIQDQEMIDHKYNQKMAEFGNDQNNLIKTLNIGWESRLNDAKKYYEEQFQLCQTNCSNQIQLKHNECLSEISKQLGIQQNQFNEKLQNQQVEFQQQIQTLNNQFNEQFQAQITRYTNLENEFKQHLRACSLNLK